MSDDLFVVAKDKSWKANVEVLLKKNFPKATVRVVIEADFLADDFEGGPTGQALHEPYVPIPDPEEIDYKSPEVRRQLGWSRA